MAKKNKKTVISRTNDQVNGTDMVQTESSLYIHNFPGKNLDYIPHSSENPFLAHTFNDYDKLGTLNLSSHNQAVMVYYSNGPMLSLDATELHQDTCKVLNKNGLKIYLTEPLCSHMVDDRYAEELFHNFNFGFYSEFYNDGNTRKFRSKELDSIWKFVRKHALTNVTVATCDYDVEKYYPLYKDHMELIYDDLFLRDLRIYDGMDPTPKEKITKKFVCPMWRYTTARYLISTVMAECDSHLSWYFAVTPNMCEQSPWANKEEMDKYFPGFRERAHDSTLKMNRAAPYELDFKAGGSTFIREHAAHNYPGSLDDKQVNDGMNPVAYNEKQHRLEKYYRETFVSVHAESRFAQPTGNYSEKAIQSVVYKTPFILVAPPYTLKAMKEAGYKTFDTWWDESYDEEENHMLRLKKIVEIIDWIETLSYDRLFEIYQDMLPILEYNLRVAVDNTQTGTMTETDNKLIHMQWQSEWANKEFDND